MNTSNAAYTPINNVFVCRERVVVLLRRRRSGRGCRTRPSRRSSQTAVTWTSRPAPRPPWRLPQQLLKRRQPGAQSMPMRRPLILAVTWMSRPAPRRLRLQQRLVRRQPGAQRSPTHRATGGRRDRMAS